MKKLFSVVLAIALMLTMFSFASAEETVADIIAQAQTMTNEELYKKAIEESNGQVMYGIGNSSRGKTAGASFTVFPPRTQRGHSPSEVRQPPRQSQSLTASILVYLTTRARPFVLRTFSPLYYALNNHLLHSRL